MTRPLLPDPPPARLATWLVWRLNAIAPSERAAVGPRLLAPLLASFGSETERARRAALADCLLRVHDGVPIPRVLLDAAVTAKLHGDVEVERRLLERLTQGEHEPRLKARVLERLGDLLEETGERSAASQQWKAAAVLGSEARHLYERALEAQPDDADAAAHLLNLYAAAGEWDRIPEVFTVVHRANETRGGELLLRLEADALEAGAHHVFVTMADEALALRAPTAGLTHELHRARTRALAADATTRAVAAAAFRSLLETFGSDEDAIAFERFLEGYAPAADAHLERRWLFAFRGEQHTAEALLSWARAEEEHGALDEAIAVYQKLLPIAGDGERVTALLKTLHLLLQRSRLEEAVVVLAELLGMAPSILRAHEIAQGLLAGARRDVVIEGLERRADEAGGESAGRIFAFLLEARAETSGLPDRRRGWYARMFELCSGAALPLSFAREAVLEAPDEPAFWSVLEQKGKDDLAEVVRTYAKAITTRPLEPAIAEELGRRMLAREIEASMPELPVVVEALERVLDLVPNAKWALDRVTLVLGARGDWDALFARYDRAVATAADAQERLALFEEAGIAARDLADDTTRAIAYFERVRAARPDAASIALALERLYERSGRVADLVVLLEERAGAASGADRQEIQRRIVALWLEAAAIERAALSLETMIADGAAIETVVDLLEQVAAHPGQDRALDRLSLHYEAARRFDDLVRIGRMALRFASDRDRHDRIRQLVRIRVAVTAAFCVAATLVAGDVADDPSIARSAYRALLVRALFSWKRATTDAQFEDAAEGVRRAIEGLTDHALNAGDHASAARLLERAARLPFERGEQRRLLHRAAVIADGLGDRPRAIRLLAEVFQDDCDDVIARGELDRFVALLERERRWSKLARFWKARANVAAKNADEANERAALERAGAAWERDGNAERAIAAYLRGATLVCWEGLARIYTEQGRLAEAARARAWLYENSPEEDLAQRAIDLAEVCCELKDTAGARACLERALLRASLPRIDAVRARLIELYREGQQWAPLADLLESAAAAGRDASHWMCAAASVRGSHLGDPAGAVRLLETARTSDPGAAAVRPLLATYLAQLGEWERVAEVLSEHLAVVPERRTAAAAMLRFDLARALVRSNKSAEALEELRVAAKIVPTHPGILRELARLALLAGDLDTAERACRAVLLANGRGDDAGSRIPIYLDLSAIALRRGDRARATRLLESALDVAIDEGHDPIAIEAALKEAGRYDLAARALEVRVDRARDGAARVQALSELVACWSEHLDCEPELGKRIRARAERALHSLAADAPRNALRLIVARVALRDPMQRHLGISALEAAIADDPADADALELLASVFEQDGNFVEVVRILAARSELLDRNQPAYAATRLRLGRVLESLGRSAAAAAVYEALLDLEPGDVATVTALVERLEALESHRLADAIEIACRLGRAPELSARLVDLRSAQADEAALVRALEIAVEFEPGLVELLVAIHEVHGDAAAALRALTRARDVVIDDDALLGRLVAAHGSLGTTSESLPFLDAALERRPEARDVRRLRARARVDAGLDEAALEDVIALGTELDVLETIATRNPGHPRSSLLLADALTESGRIEEAAAVIERVLVIDADHVEALERAAALATRRGLWHEAANAYERLLAAHADDRKWAHADRLCSIYEATKDWRRLVGLLVSRAEHEASVARRGQQLLRAATLTFEELGDAKEAARLTDLARAADETLEAALLAAKIEMALGKADAAIRILERAAERGRGKRSPILANVYLECAKAHLALDELACAMECLKTGFGISVLHPELAMLLGLVAMDLGENATAERALVAVVTFASPSGPSDPSSAEDRSTAYGHLATIAKWRGDMTKARHWSAKAALAPARRARGNAWPELAMG
jgi:golgin subfamily B member 1